MTRPRRRWLIVAAAVVVMSLAGNWVWWSGQIDQRFTGLWLVSPQGESTSGSVTTWVLLADGTGKVFENFPNGNNRLSTKYAEFRWFGNSRRLRIVNYLGYGLFGYELPVWLTPCSAKRNLHEESLGEKQICFVDDAGDRSTIARIAKEDWKELLDRLKHRPQ